jgi:hypothetical protein
MAILLRVLVVPISDSGLETGCLDRDFLRCFLYLFYDMLGQYIIYSYYFFVESNCTEGYVH